MVYAGLWLPIGTSFRIPMSRSHSQIICRWVRRDEHIDLRIAIYHSAILENPPWKAMEIAEFHSSRCSHLERSWLWSPKAELGIRKNGLGIKRSSLHTYHLLRSCGLVASFTSCSGKIYSTDTTDEHFDAMQDWYDSYSQANTYKSSTDELLAAVMKQSVANI